MAHFPVFGSCDDLRSSLGCLFSDDNLKGMSETRLLTNKRMLLTEIAACMGKTKIDILESYVKKIERRLAAVAA